MTLTPLPFDPRTLPSAAESATINPAPNQAGRLPELLVRCDDCDGSGFWYDPNGDPDLGIPPGEWGCGECDGLGWRLTPAGHQLRLFLRRVCA